MVANCLEPISGTDGIRRYLKTRLFSEFTRFRHPKSRVLSANSNLASLLLWSVSCECEGVRVVNVINNAFVSG